MIFRAMYHILQWNLTKTNMEPQSPESQAKCKALWDDFLAKVKKEGFTPVLHPIIKAEISDGMNQREKNLVAVIANTYLVGAISFQSSEPEKPADTLIKPDDSLKK